MADSTSGSATRLAALAILRAVRSETPFDVALDTAIEKMPSNDARLTHELAAGALRHRRTLDAAIRPFVDASWDRVEPDVRDILRIGAHQILNLDRIPPYAAVQSTVEASKRECRRASGLVNAVLRRIADTPKPTSFLSLAEQFSHPDWLVKRWIGRFGESRATALLQHNNQRPTLTIRPARWSLDRLVRAFTDTNIAYTLDSSFLRIPDPGPVRELAGYSDGAFVVQDGGQARLTDYARFDDHMQIWDACAAPGGKEVVKAVDHPVLASDRSRERIQALAHNLDRVQRRASLFVTDARHPPLPNGILDAVLVDAPCTGTGTFGRHPDARWRISPARLARAVDQQAEILDSVAPIVRPGGLLVYLTCSLESDENEDRVDTFLRSHPEYQRDEADLFIFPTDHDTDGGFGARLRRGP